MASQIATIYDTLAAKSLTVSSTAVTAKDADQIPNSLNTADLPVRILTPLLVFGGDVLASGSIWGASSGSAVSQTLWTINDVMYWRPVHDSVGVRAHAKILVAYASAYLDMLKTDTSLAALGVVNLTHTISTNVLNYPRGSGNWYYGVTCTLVITEKGL